MRHRRPLHIAKFIGFAIVAMTVLGFAVMLLWNALVPGLAAPAVKLPGWDEVGRQLRTVYELVLSTSR